MTTPKTPKTAKTPKTPKTPTTPKTYCEADTARSADTAKPILKLVSDLSLSLRKPGRRTLTLINKALGYLTPFESGRARTSSPSERRDLLDLLTTHRWTLSPYLDVDRIERNLRKSSVLSLQS